MSGWLPRGRRCLCSVSHEGRDLADTPVVFFFGSGIWVSLGGLCVDHVGRTLAPSQPGRPHPLLEGLPAGSGAGDEWKATTRTEKDGRYIVGEGERGGRGGGRGGAPPLWVLLPWRRRPVGAGATRRGVAGEGGDSGGQGVFVLCAYGRRP